MATKPGNGYISPFGNGDGAVTTPTTNGTDFSANPTGQSSKDGGRNFAAEPVEQTNDTSSTAPDAPHLRSREQQSTTFAQRVAPESIAANDGSPFPKAQAPASRAGTGSIGNDRRPFKGLK